MKITEVFIEQVLIGALVLLSGGLMFWDAAREFISSPDIDKIVLKGTVLMGVDRMALT
jgi:hypothetical protein